MNWVYFDITNITVALQCIQTWKNIFERVVFVVKVSSNCSLAHDLRFNVFDINMMR